MLDSRLMLLSVIGVGRCRGFMLVSTSLDGGFRISQFTEFSLFYDLGQTDRQPTKNHTNQNVHKVGIELWWHICCICTIFMLFYKGTQRYKPTSDMAGQGSSRDYCCRQTIVVVKHLAGNGLLIPYLCSMYVGAPLLNSKWLSRSVPM